MQVIHYSTLASVRPRQSIADRKSKITAIKKAERHQHIKNNLLIIALILCIIGAAWVDGGVR